MRRRTGSGAREGAVRVPHSTSTGCRADSPSTTPYPSTAVPGSMPSTLTGVPSGFRLGQLSCVDIEVGENLGNVLQLFEHVHEPYNALGVGPFHPNRVAGNHCELG